MQTGFERVQVPSAGHCNFHSKEWEGHYDDVRKEFKICAEP